MWNRLRALIVKELLAILKDKRARVVLVAPPMIQVIVFGYAASFDLNHVPYAVLNQDSGPASRELLARFEGSPTFSLRTHLRHDGEIRPAIENRRVLMVVRIPSDFSRDLAAGRQGRVQMILDGRNSNTAAVALSHGRRIFAEFAASQARSGPERGLPPQLVVRAWFNPNLLSRWFFVPGIVGLLTLVVTLLVTALSVAREREFGTFDQLLVTPLRPYEILAGKAIPAVLIGLVEASAITAVIVILFDVPFRGSAAALYLGLFLFLLSTIGVGLMISSLAVTQQQGLLGAFLFLVPAVILSGFSTPIDNMPEPLQMLTYLNPLRYFLLVVRGVFLEGASIHRLWPQYWPMAAIGCACLLAAARLFRLRMH